MGRPHREPKGSKGWLNGRRDDFSHECLGIQEFREEKDGYAWVRAISKSKAILMTEIRIIASIVSFSGLITSLRAL